MFANIFKKTNDSDSSLNRIDLLDESQIEEILSLSQQKPVLLFKHSSRCGISSIVLKKFQSSKANLIIEYHYFFLDIFKYRNLSNIIAQKFNVRHESPQLIVFDKGRVKDHNSHYGIIDVKL